MNFEITPNRRFAFSFWVGAAAQFASLESVLLFQRDDLLWVVAAICLLILIIIYGRNLQKFKDEHMWMILKTGGPTTSLTRPGRPIAPPPAGRHLPGVSPPRPLNVPRKPK